MTDFHAWSSVFCVLPKSMYDILLDRGPNESISGCLVGDVHHIIGIPNGEDMLERILDLKIPHNGTKPSKTHMSAKSSPRFEPDSMLMEFPTYPKHCTLAKRFAVMVSKSSADSSAIRRSAIKTLQALSLIHI